MKNESKIQLCPVQQSALESVMRGLQIGSIFRVWGGVGRGKTTVLRQVHQQTGGAFLRDDDGHESRQSAGGFDPLRARGIVA